MDEQKTTEPEKYLNEEAYEEDGEGIDAEEGFRKEALEEHSLAQQSYHTTQIVHRQSWLALLSLGLLLLSGLLWFFLGTIVTRVNGNGLLVQKEGALHSVIVKGAGGYVDSIAVDEGDSVKKGQTLGVVVDPDAKNKFENMQILVRQTQKDYNNLLKQSKEAIQKRTQIANNTRDLTLRIIEVEQIKKGRLEKLVIIKEAANKKGVVSGEDLIQTQLEYAEVSKSLLNHQKTLEDIDITLNLYKEEWNQKILTLKLQLDMQKKDLDTLKDFALEHDTLKSPIDGIVSFIQAKEGDAVKGGESLFYVSSPNAELLAQVYVPAKDGKLVETGMQAEIVPSVTQELEYGAIKGEVVQVSPYPETMQSIESFLKNRYLVRRFLGQEPVIAVRIKLFRNAGNISGFDWTSSSGPPFHLTEGTIVKASVLTKRQHPVSLIIPRLKKLVHDQTTYQKDN